MQEAELGKLQVGVAPRIQHFRDLAKAGQAPFSSLKANSFSPGPPWQHTSRELLPLQEAAWANRGAGGLQGQLPPPTPTRAAAGLQVRSLKLLPFCAKPNPCPDTTFRKTCFLRAAQCFISGLTILAQLKLTVGVCCSFSRSLVLMHREGCQPLRFYQSRTRYTGPLRLLVPAVRIPCGLATG